VVTTLPIPPAGEAQCVVTPASSTKGQAIEPQQIAQDEGDVADHAALDLIGPGVDEANFGDGELS